MPLLDRYAALLGDEAPAFLTAAAAPLPVALWANPLRAEPAETAERIRRRCPDARPIPWAPHAWRLPAGTTPGRWPEFLMGLVHVQEEAALLPAVVLGAAPGERLLDTCAAPGGKTAQLAAAMADRGSIWAVDRSAGRLTALRRTLERLGVTSVAALCEDAARLPAPSVPFDRVLADVPCSCEGTTRKTHGRRDATTDGARAFLSAVQRRILARALALVRPGGVVVYATCTYAPEENEAVLDSVPVDVAAIEPVAPLPGLRTRPGLDTWEGRSYRPDCRNALRLWPQDNDTGGFFVARLRRL